MATRGSAARVVAVSGRDTPSGTITVHCFTAWGVAADYLLPLSAVETVIGPVEEGDELIVAITLTELRRAGEPGTPINLVGDEEE